MNETGQLVIVGTVFAIVVVLLPELLKTFILGVRMRIAGAKWTTNITKGPPAPRSTGEDGEPMTVDPKSHSSTEKKISPAYRSRANSV